MPLEDIFPVQEHLEDEDDETPDGGEPSSETLDDPEAIAEHLSSLGVPDDVVQSIRKGYLRQADYTRKSQAIANVMKQAQVVAQERDWLMQKLQQGDASGQGGSQKPSGQQGSSLIDQFFEEAGGEFADTPEVRDYLKKFGMAVAQEAIREVQGYVAPVAATARETEFSRVMSDYHSALQEKYDGLDSVWNEVAAIVKAHIDKGIVKEPESVLWELDPDRAAAMRAKAQARKHKTKHESALEGFARMRRESPVQGNSGTEPGQSRDMSTRAILKRVEARLAKLRR